MNPQAQGPGPRGTALEPLRDADHAAVLDAALNVRSRGGIPLIGDERWDDEHWRMSVAAATRRELPEDAAWAGFTSGSTAAPRIVVRSHTSWECSFKEVTRLLQARVGDTMLIPVHPVSSMALYAAAHAQATGLQFVVPGAVRLRETDLDGPELMHGTPWHLREALGLIESGARSTLRAVLIGGDRLAEHIAARARRAGLRVVGYAGAAELSFVAVDTGTGLRAFPGVELRVDDDGILWTRTEQLCSAVLGDGSSLRTATEPETEPGSHGQLWATVGDRAALDGGRLTLHGRAGEVILTAGATVLPCDVEAVLDRIPGVRASLVVAAPDLTLGHRVAAFIEPESGADLDRRALLRSARAQLTPAQYPRILHRVPELPRTASGKVRRLDYTEAQRLTGQTA